MKAILMTGVGEPAVLKLQDLPTPTIKSPGEVLVRLKAAGVNPIDTKLRKGAYAVDPLPTILGCDGAGIIESIGNDVTKFNVGDEVYFFYGGLSGIPGNYAEYIVLDERFLARKPENLSFEEAAAAPLVLLTAWEALFDRARLEKDQSVLIHAGAGGVGHVAIQLAKHFGAKIAATISNGEKAKLVDSLGADKIINYKEEDFVSAIMDWTEDHGVDVVMDNVGGDLIEASFPAIKFYGSLVSLLLADSSIDWTQARLRNINFSQEVMLSPLMFDLVDAQKHQTWILNECTKLFESGELRIHVQEVLALEQAAKAHELIEQGSSTGKIVLRIAT